jgi:hypothetical protein
MEELSAESCGPDRGNRFLHGAHSDFQRVVLLRRTAVTAHPTALWAAQQIIEAFPEETARRFLLRDRDQIYGEHFRGRVVGMGIQEVVTAAHSPWQKAYASHCTSCERSTTTSARGSL